MSTIFKKRRKPPEKRLLLGECDREVARRSATAPVACHDELSWQDLRRKYLLALETTAKHSPDRCAKLWHVFASHPWFLRQLEYCAKRVANNCSVTDVDDVKHDALLLLLRDLKRHTDLRIGQAKRFDQWLRAIATQLCRQVMRRARQRCKRQRSLADREFETGSADYLDMAMDLQSAIGRLDDAMREVILLRHDGLSTKAIADHLQLSYPKARYRLDRGLRRLREILGK